MSLPNIPDITPKIELEREEAITMLLASIALEEMGLAHILHAEGEKVQYLLKAEDVCASDLLAINESVEQVIKSITRLQIILQDKLETVARLIPNEHEPCPNPKPWPKPKCILIGSGIGTVQNRDDDFFGATAALEAKERRESKSGPYPLTYTLFKRSKGGAISAVLVPIPTELKISCGQTLQPCPTPEKPNSLTMQGKGIMCLQTFNEERHQATVQFKLNVWDYGIRSSFQMTTWGAEEIYAHNSGLVEVTQGDLRIKIRSSLLNQRVN